MEQCLTDNPVKWAPFSWPAISGVWAGYMEPQPPESSLRKGQRSLLLRVRWPRKWARAAELIVLGMQGCVMRQGCHRPIPVSHMAP